MTKIRKGGIFEGKLPLKISVSPMLDPPIPERPKPVGCLSYSAVPGMNTGSHSFHRAQAMIPKQASPERKV